MGSGEIFQGVQGLFRLALLHDAHYSVENDNQQDQKRLKKFLGLAFHAGDDKGNCRRSQQNQNHDILKLGQKTLKISFFLFFRQFILAKLS